MKHQVRSNLMKLSSKLIERNHLTLSRLHNVAGDGVKGASVQGLD